MSEEGRRIDLRRARDQIGGCMLPHPPVVYVVCEKDGVYVCKSCIMEYICICMLL